MQISVKFFASLREQVGFSVTTAEVAEDVSLRQVWRIVTNDSPLPDNVLCALNFEYVSLQQLVSDGDEVAFFPPVTGG